MSDGSLVNLLASRVVIAAVDGASVPETLAGSVGGMDLLLAAPGRITFQVDSVRVPAGPSIGLAVKPRVGGGGEALHETGLINEGSCDGEGNCTTYINIDLPGGAYFAEAAATFQIPWGTSEMTVSRSANVQPAVDPGSAR